MAQGSWTTSAFHSFNLNFRLRDILLCSPSSLFTSLHLLVLQLHSHNSFSQIDIIREPILSRKKIDALKFTLTVLCTIRSSITTQIQLEATWVLFQCHNRCSWRSTLECVASSLCIETVDWILCPRAWAWGYIDIIWCCKAKERHVEHNTVDWKVSNSFDTAKVTYNLTSCEKCSWTTIVIQKY